jgi:hypothetical protein
VLLASAVSTVALFASLVRGAEAFISVDQPLRLVLVVVQQVLLVILQCRVVVKLRLQLEQAKQRVVAAMLL